MSKHILNRFINLKTFAIVSFSLFLIVMYKTYSNPVEERFNSEKPVILDEKRIIELISSSASKKCLYEKVEKLLENNMNGALTDVDIERLESICSRTAARDIQVGALKKIKID